MIIVVSDVHLGYNKSNYAEFGRFLEKCNGTDIDHLVLLGDIIDFWRHNNAETVMDEKYAGIFNALEHLKAKNVHYIVGNHDYHLLKLSERYKKEHGDPYPFAISRSLRLEDGDSKFYFIHGYELEVFTSLEHWGVDRYEKFSDYMCYSEDTMGMIASDIWDMIQKRRITSQKEQMQKTPHERIKVNAIYRFVKSAGAFMLLGMRPGEKLVFGHTHRPFITRDNMIANTGSWVDELSKEKSQNKYVKIVDGQMELKTFDEQNFP